MGPLLVLLVLLVFIPVEPFNIILLTLGYCWPMSLLTPGLNSRTTSFKYKYAFIKFAYQTHRIIVEATKAHEKPWLEAGLRGAGPLAFALLLVFASKSGNILYCFAGFVFFEVMKKVFHYEGWWDFSRVDLATDETEPMSESAGMRFLDDENWERDQKDSEKAP